MFPTYMAVLHNGSLEWLGETPDAPDPTTVFVTLVGEDAPRHQTYVGSNRELLYRVHVEGGKGRISGLIGDYSEIAGFTRALTEQHAEDAFLLTLEFRCAVEFARLHYLAEHHDFIVLGLELVRDEGIPGPATGR